MDVTAIFKKHIKPLATSLKAGSSRSNDQNDSKTDIKQLQLFTSKAKITVGELAKLYQIIIEHRRTYFKPDRLISNNSLSNEEMDFIVQNIIQKCMENVKDLRNRINYATTSQQILEHQQNIVAAVENYLKFVRKTYVDTRHNHEKKKELIFKINTTPVKKERKVSDVNEPEEKPQEKPVITTVNDESREKLYYEDDVPTQEDIQIFESENEQLHNELNALSEDIMQIESKVTSITELQNLFADKVLTQDKDLENVMSKIVGSTENVIEANEQIRKAIQRNASFRVYVLFSIIVLSFTLIFLDWYNP